LTPVAFAGALFVASFVASKILVDPYHTEYERATGYVISEIELGLAAFVVALPCAAVAPTHRGIAGMVATAIYYSLVLAFMVPEDYYYNVYVGIAQCAAVALAYVLALGTVRGVIFILKDPGARA
jgi:hypothetical protein